MMRAEPWRKQSLHIGDPLPEPYAPREYESVSNYNWNEERKRVAEVIGFESFKEFAEL